MGITRARCRVEGLGERCLLAAGHGGQHESQRHRWDGGAEPVSAWRDGFYELLADLKRWAILAGKLLSVPVVLVLTFGALGKIGGDGAQYGLGFALGAFALAALFFGLQGRVRLMRPRGSTHWGAFTFGPIGYLLYVKILGQRIGSRWTRDDGELALLLPFWEISIFYDMRRAMPTRAWR